MKLTHKFKYSSSQFLCLSLIASSALTSTASAAIDEVVVTTRKRAESLQSVPIAVQAFTADQIERFGIADIADVAKLSSSLQFDSNFGPLDNRVTIRGLSQTRGRPSAAILVDGIDVTTESVSFNGTGALLTQRLLDVERIEVVKGPQSALYGRSAFNGAVQYITRDPSMDGMEARASIDIGDYGRYELKGAVSGPVVDDKFALGLNANWWSEDGFYEHPATLEDVGGGEGWGLATTFVFEPNDTLKLRGRLAYADDEFDTAAQTTIRHNKELLLTDPANGVAAGCTGMVFSASACAGRIYPILEGNIGDASGRDVSTSLNPRTGGVYPGTERSYFRASLYAEWDLDSITLSSWTGYTEGEDSFFIDGDFDADLIGPVGNQTDASTRAQEFDFEDDTKQFSQEIRLATKLDGPVQFTLGGLYWTEEINQIDNSRIVDSFGMGPTNPALPFVELRPTYFDRETDHWSVYGSVDWAINDQWTAIFEGRYTSEETSVTGPYAVPLGACLDSFGFGCTAPSFPDAGDLFAFAMGGAAALPTGVIRANPQAYLTEKVDDNFFTPKVTIEYSPNDDMLLYAYIARGIKPGGVSSVSAGSYFDADADGTANEFKFDQEKLWVYEAGMKSTWADGRLQTNVAAFFQEYDDKQVTSRGLASPTAAFETGLVVNAGAAEIWGVELETQWQPNDNWLFGASYTFLDTEYTDFVIDTTSPTQALRSGNCTVVPDPDTATPECLVSLTGNEIERTPKHALNLTGRYQRPIGNGDLNWFFEGNSSFQGKRFIDESNTKRMDDYWLTDLRTGIETDRWSVLAYVNNVFDDDTIRSGVDAGGFVDATLTPGTFGFTFAPADNLIASLPDPRHWGVRASIRY